MPTWEVHGEGWGEGHKLYGKQEQQLPPRVTASSPQPSPPKEERETESSVGGSVKMRSPRRGQKENSCHVPGNAVQ